MAMLKLTDGGHGASDNTVYIMAKHIVGMYRWGSYTYVTTVGGSSFMAKESPEEIMAMEAMVKEMYPGFIVQGDKIEKVR